MSFENIRNIHEYLKEAFRLGASDLKSQICDIAKAYNEVMI